MSAGFELLVFDWDGTLMDSEVRIVAAIQGAIDDVGAPARNADAIREIIGLGLLEAIRVLFPEEEPALHQQLAGRYRDRFLYGDQIHSTLFPGAEDTLRNLRDQGFLLGVATSKGRGGLNAELERSGLKDLFHSTRCADDAPSKPHPGMLLQLMDELGAVAQRTLMIGDTEYDMQMARNAGANRVAVSCGVHSSERLLQHEPLAVLEHIGELGGWLERRAETDWSH